MIADADAPPITCEAFSSATREGALFWEWVRTNDPRTLARMFRVQAEWAALLARGTEYDV